VPASLGSESASQEMCAAINTGPTLGLEFGDINLDFSLDSGDIDMLSQFILGGAYSSVFPSSDGQEEGAFVLLDVNLDQVVTSIDKDILIRERMGTEYGDVNLDGMVTLADRNYILNNWGFSGGWSVGDMNGDGVVGLADYNLCMNNFGFGTALSIPEPTTLSVAFCMVCSQCLMRRSY
jgi:hypothetical protein